MGIDEKLLELQQKLPNPALDETNPHFRNDFVSMPGLREHLVPSFNKAGLLVDQGAVFKDGVWQVVTTVTDVESNESRGYFFPLIIDDTNPQKTCAAYSYARRYSLISVLCMVGEHDDDGNKAAGIPDNAWDRRNSSASKLKKKFNAKPVQTTMNEESPFNDEPDGLPESDPAFVDDSDLDPLPDTTGDPISEKQAKFLFMINNWGTPKDDKESQAANNEALKNYLSSQGIESTRDLPWKSMDTVIRQIPKWNPDAAEKVKEIVAQNEARRRSRRRK